MFHEICIYEAKVEKQDEIEALMREVAGFYREQPGVIDVKYVKRTHRQAGRPHRRLQSWAGMVTFVRHGRLVDGVALARVSRLGLERFYRRWNRCLITMPKILLGEDVV